MPTTSDDAARNGERIRVADHIRGFVLRHSSASAAGGLRDDDDIFERGFATSIFAMQLLDFVESQFEIEVADDEITLANFRSVDAMVDVVLRAHASVP